VSYRVSVRFRNSRVAKWRQSEAAANKTSTSPLAKELIEDYRQVRRRPLVNLRDRTAGRRAHVVDGSDVWEVMDGLVEVDVLASPRIERAIEVSKLRHGQIEVTLGYYV